MICMISWGTPWGYRGAKAYNDQEDSSKRRGPKDPLEDPLGDMVLGWQTHHGDTVDGSEIQLTKLRLVVEIPLFTTGFSTIPGGKPRQISSLYESTRSLWISIFPTKWRAKGCNKVRVVRTNQIIICMFLIGFFSSKYKWFTVMVEVPPSTSAERNGNRRVHQMRRKRRSLAEAQPSLADCFSAWIFRLHPWKLTWNPKMKGWKMIFLFKGVIFRWTMLVFWGVSKKKHGNS